MKPRRHPAPPSPAVAAGGVADLVDAVEALAEAFAPGSVAAVNRDPDDEEDEWPSMLPLA